MRVRNAVRELVRYRQLLYMITYRDIRVKYKQSVMGLLWAVLMPALVVLAGVMVRVAYARASGQPLMLGDVAGVAVKSIPWAFLVASIRFASACLITNTSLVTKIYFPKEIFPFAAVGSQLFDLAIASVVLALLLTLAGTGASLQLLWLPLLLAVLVLLALGVGTVVSAASLFFRDVKYIVEILVTFGIFFTPVFYEVDLFGSQRHLLMLNPAAPILEGFRNVIVLHRPPELGWFLYAAVVAAVTAGGSYVFFKRLEPRFAESI